MTRKRNLYIRILYIDIYVNKKKHTTVPVHLPIVQEFAATRAVRQTCILPADLALSSSRRKNVRWQKLAAPVDQMDSSIPQCFQCTPDLAPDPVLGRPYPMDPASSVQPIRLNCAVRLSPSFLDSYLGSPPPCSIRGSQPDPRTAETPYPTGGLCDYRQSIILYERQSQGAFNSVVNVHRFVI